MNMAQEDKFSGMTLLSVFYLICFFLFICLLTFPVLVVAYVIFTICVAIKLFIYSSLH